MMSIRSLLNPQPALDSIRTRSSIYPSRTLAPTVLPTLTPSPISNPPMTSSRQAPRPKAAKDATVFTKGHIRGEMKYPPWECTEQHPGLSKEERYELQVKQRLHEIFPSGGSEGLIAEHAQRIPYNSEKKTFLGKTGRDGFEVVKYTFKKPATGEVFTIMWDYQNGLTRITPFFKALDYAKTTPNKVLLQNPGLRDLSHSITGGAIFAQGYWMPFECARAVCQTFCYEICWALTPIFGPSFVKDCLTPTDPKFASFLIQPDIIRDAGLKAVGNASRAITPASGISGARTSPDPSGHESESPTAADRSRNDSRNLKVDSHVSSSYSVSGKSRSTTPFESLSARTRRPDARWNPINGHETPPSPSSSASFTDDKVRSKAKGKAKQIPSPPSPSPTKKKVHKDTRKTVPISPKPSASKVKASGQYLAKRKRTVPSLQLNGTTALDSASSTSKEVSSDYSSSDSDEEFDPRSQVKKQKTDFPADVDDAAEALLQIATSPIEERHVDLPAPRTYTDREIEAAHAMLELYYSGGRVAL